MAGIRDSGMRPRTSKHLRTGTKKKFRNESPESRAKYATKINARRARKLKKNK